MPGIREAQQWVSAQPTITHDAVLVRVDLDRLNQFVQDHFELTGDGPPVDKLSRRLRELSSNGRLAQWARVQAGDQAGRNMEPSSELATALVKQYRPGVLSPERQPEQQEELRELSRLLLVVDEIRFRQDPQGQGDPPSTLVQRAQAQRNAPPRAGDHRPLEVRERRVLEQAGSFTGLDAEALTPPAAGATDDEERAARETLDRVTDSAAEAATGGVGDRVQAAENLYGRVGLPLAAAYDEIVPASHRQAAPAYEQASAALDLGAAIDEQLGNGEPESNQGGGDDYSEIDMVLEDLGALAEAPEEVRRETVSTGRLSPEALEQVRQSREREDPGRDDHPPEERGEA